jgi:hypothetical protein
MEMLMKAILQLDEFLFRWGCEEVKVNQKRIRISVVHFTFHILNQIFDEFPFSTEKFMLRM